MAQGHRLQSAGLETTFSSSSAELSVTEGGLPPPMSPSPGSADYLFHHAGPRNQEVEDVLESIVRGNTMGQLHEPLEPGLALLGEQSEVTPTITVSNHTPDSNDNNVRQQVPRPPSNTRIVEPAKTSLDRHHARSGHTSLLVPGSLFWADGAIFPPPAAGPGWPCKEIAMYSARQHSCRRLRPTGTDAGQPEFCTGFAYAIARTLEAMVEDEGPKSLEVEDDRKCNAIFLRGLRRHARIW